MTTARVPRYTREDHFFAQLNLRDVDVEGSDLSIELPTADNLTNSRGSLQGGLIATLADIVAGRLALRGLPDESSVATSDLTIHYLTPIRVGPARADGHVVRRGSRSVVVRVDVFDVATDKLAAVATLSFAVMSPLTKPTST